MSWNSRTNRIPIKWVNHNGWIDIFVIKKLLFLFVFSTYLPVFLLKFRSGEFFGCGINEYPLSILLTDPATPKPKKIPEKTWWWCHHHAFHLFLVFGVAGSIKSMLSGYSLGQVFRIQLDLMIEIWVKTRGDMSKIQIKKVVFFYDTFPQIYIKKVFETYTVFQI